MTRDLARLTSTRFDVLVVGGGIHGLFAAYDAALRGMTVALIDRVDFGSGATSTLPRTLHGGLEALEHGHLARCRMLIQERRMWARLAPHLVRPLPFLVGTYRGTRRSRTVVRMGLRLYDVLARRRSLDVLPELHLPKGRLESAAATRRLFPGIHESGLSGGAIWYEYQPTHLDRLTWCVALAAAASGVTLANYVAAVRPVREGAALGGVEARDEHSGATLAISTDRVILAAGDRQASLHEAFGLAPPPPLVRTMSVLLDRPARDIALAAPVQRHRIYTAVPWHGRMLVGTYQDAEVGQEADVDSREAAIERCLTDANAAFSTLHATRADVVRIYEARLPAVVAHGRTTLLSDPIVKTESPHPGVVSLVGTRFTTARLGAVRAVDALGAARGTGESGRRLLPHADVADSDGLLQEVLMRLRRRLEPDVMRHLASWYGTEGAAVVESAADGDGLERLTAETTVLCGEIRYHARRSSVVRLADLVLRRTALASAGNPGDQVLERAAAVAADVLGWSEETKRSELSAVRSALTR